MADEQQAEQIVEEIPQAPTPSADQTTETQNEVIETSQTETEPQSEANPRTEERIKKLTQDLREAREQLQRAPQAPAIPTWYDPVNQTVDPNSLMSELQTLKQQVSGYNKQQEVAQEKEALASYPDLFSNEKFHEKVIQEMAVSINLGNPLTVKEAADRVMDFAKGLTTKAEKDGARKALEQLAPKEQASLEATGRSDRRPASQDLASLSRQSRYGGDSGMSAVLARLKNIPSV